MLTATNKAQRFTYVYLLILSTVHLGGQSPDTSFTAILGEKQEYYNQYIGRTKASIDSSGISFSEGSGSLVASNFEFSFSVLYGDSLHLITLTEWVYGQWIIRDIIVIPPFIDKQGVGLECRYNGVFGDVFALVNVRVLGYENLEYQPYKAWRANLQTKTLEEVNVDSVECFSPY